MHSAGWLCLAYFKCCNSLMGAALRYVLRAMQRTCRVMHIAYFELSIFLSEMEAE